MAKNLSFAEVCQLSPKERSVIEKRYGLAQFDFVTMVKQLIPMVPPKIREQMADPFLIVQYPDIFYTIDKYDFICISKYTNEYERVKYTIKEEEKTAPGYSLNIYFYSNNCKIQQAGQKLYFTGPHAKLTASCDVLANIPDKSSYVYLKNAVKDDFVRGLIWDEFNRHENLHFRKHEMPRKVSRKYYQQFITWIDNPEEVAKELRKTHLKLPLNLQQNPLL